MTDAIQFLLDRLREFEGEIDSEDLAREWFGHVTPAIVRTEYQLQAEHEPAEYQRRSKRQGSHPWQTITKENYDQFSTKPAALERFEFRVLFEHPPERQDGVILNAVEKFIVDKKSWLDQYTDENCYLEPDTNATVWD